MFSGKAPGSDHLIFPDPFQTPKTNVVHMTTLKEMLVPGVLEKNFLQL